MLGLLRAAQEDVADAAAGGATVLAVAEVDAVEGAVGVGNGVRRRSRRRPRKSLRRFQSKALTDVLRPSGR